MEPPRPHVPVERVPPAAVAVPEPVSALRLIAAAAAVGTVLVGDGHALLLGLLVAGIVATRAGAIASLVATTAVIVRWGGPSLAAVAGGQAVLGPAITLGSAGAALASLLAALALVLVAPRTPVLAVAVGVVAASLAIGPELPHDVGIRLVGALAGCGLALAARWVPLREWLAIGLALVAVLAAA